MDQTRGGARQVFFEKRGEKPAWSRDAIRFDVGAWACGAAARASRCGATLRKRNLHPEFPL
jgi:hypothetical protein